MSWTCRIDPQAGRDDEVVVRNPMAVVQMAQELQLWPEVLYIVSQDLPPEAEVRHQWEKACRACAAHDVCIWLDDMPWNPDEPLRPQWPTGNPMDWPRTTPQAWDVESGALMPEVGDVWWRRQSGSGPWVMAYLADVQGLSTPEEIGVALQATCPTSAARVRMDEAKWWCAWPRTPANISGADWARRLWAVLGAVRLGTSLVTESETWAERLKQAVNVARTEPGTRVAALPPEATEVLRDTTLEEIAKVQRLEKQRQVEAQQRQEQEARQRAEQAELERLAAEKDQLLLQKEQLVAEAEARRQAQVEKLRQEVEALQAEQAELAEALAPSKPQSETPVSDQAQSHAEDDGAEVEQLAALRDQLLRQKEQLAAEAKAQRQVQTEKLRQEIEALQTDPESLPADRAERPTGNEKAIENADSAPSVAGVLADQKDEGNPSPLRRQRLTIAPSHWRPEQPPQWDRHEVIQLPLRKRRVPASSSPNTQEEATALSQPAAELRQSVNPPGRSEAEHCTEMHSSSGALTLPWVAWVWGDARKAGTSTAALALARWLAWVQTTPVRLLEGHLMAPGLARLIQTASIPLTWGWEGPWQAGKPMCDPRSPVALTKRLTVWVLAPHSVTKVVHAESKWLQVLQHMTDAVIVIDGGLMPPPSPTITLPICVVRRGTHTPDVPSRAWLAYRGVPTRADQALRLPAEALGAEGVGSAAWTATWEPLWDVLGLSSAEGFLS